MVRDRTGGPAQGGSDRCLVADGVKVIADDTSYSTEPFFQDGVIAQAVDRAKAAGVAYFASAGNDAQHSWGGTYSPVGDPSGLSATTEDFDPGGAVDTGRRSAPSRDDAYPGPAVGRALGPARRRLRRRRVAPGGAMPITVDTNNVVTGLPVEAGSSRPAQAAIEVAIRRVRGRAIRS